MLIHPCSTLPSQFNSLAPGRFQINFRHVIFKRTLVNGGWGISYEISLIWISLDLTDDKSTLVQVMAWSCQATSHYLSQCWLRSMSPNGVTRPRWVNKPMTLQAAWLDNYIPQKIMITYSCPNLCVHDNHLQTCWIQVGLKGWPPMELLRRFATLRSVIRRCNSSAVLLFSSVLPRLKNLPSISSMLQDWILPWRKCVPSLRRPVSKCHHIGTFWEEEGPGKSYLQGTVST